VNALNAQAQIDELQAQVLTLEQLLEVYEQETLEKSARLEKALEDLQHYSAQLEHSEAALQVVKSILASMGDCVMVADEQGKFLFLNHPAEALFGVSLELSLAEWMAGDAYCVYLSDAVTRYPAAEFPLMRAVQGQPTNGAEVLARSPDHSTMVWLSVTARSLTDRDGNLSGGVAVFHDITQMKQAEAALRQSEATSRAQALQLQKTLHELRQTQAQLIQTEKMSSLGQLVAGIAHEINNPVNFIYGNLKPANEYAKDLLYLVSLYQRHYPQPVAEIQSAIDAMDLEFIQEDLNKLLRSLEIGANRIRAIVLSLRNFSRLDEAEMKPVNIHEGIENTLLILQNRLKPKVDSRGINVIKEFADLPLVECYAGQLNQVFMNLVANAIDALEEVDESRWQIPQLAQSSLVGAECNQAVLPTQVKGFPLATLPTIRIRTQVQGNQIQVAIADNGSGIPESVRDRLFDPFYTTKPVGRGTGLGLYISFQIIEKHKGTLRCISEPNQGTEFIIDIPIAKVDGSA